MSSQQEQLEAKVRKIVAHATYQVLRAGDGITFESADQIHDEATQAINKELLKAERKAYKKGQLNPACQICKKPLKLATNYHQKCWSKSIDELSSSHRQKGESR